ncbi:MAG: MFS transporter [Saprospiraceae bacterium]|nr:MFS transporter [Saprospiraceae bacterium]
MSSKEGRERPLHILPVIVLAQFAGTSLWFAGNAILPDLQATYQLPDSALGNITSAVQFGFIVGTLLYAILLIADRFSPSRVFMVSAVLGALCNITVGWLAESYFPILVARFFTGFFLAGIYPVGMKIASDWYKTGLGKALGYLVGALVLGTAFPHFLRFSTASLSWQSVVIGTSVLAFVGGILLRLTVPDGPYSKPGSRFDPRVILDMFKISTFRSAAFGYFGHMWELYAFWAFVPFALSIPIPDTSDASFSLYCFVVIALGGLGCIGGGYISAKRGSAKVAFGMLLVSGILCLLSPVFLAGPNWLILPLLGLWGLTVVGDSPQFSTLVAQNAPAAYRGSALTIVNCLGFTITIISIQLLNYLLLIWPVSLIFWPLVLGPILGLRALVTSDLLT